MGNVVVIDDDDDVDSCDRLMIRIKIVVLVISDNEDGNYGDVGVVMGMLMLVATIMIPWDATIIAVIIMYM